MARVKTKKELTSVYDVVRDIIVNQPIGEIVINFKKTEDRRRLEIKGDKYYVLSCFDNDPTKLFIDDGFVRGDITPIPKRGFVSDIENILYYNQRMFEYKEYKDMDTGNILFFVKKKA